MSTRKPIIGIPADRRLPGHHYFHCMGDQYLAAVTEGAQTMPVLIPSLGDALEARELHRYPGPASDPDTLRECARLEGAQLWSAKVR